jgi:hypothetical protein
MVSVLHLGLLKNTPSILSLDHVPTEDFHLYSLMDGVTVITDF